MPRGGYLTSTTLLETIKREAMVPTSNFALSDADFLAMANQELKIGMMPSIMQYHQEFGVRTDPPIVINANQSAYEIPYRAVGSKVREVFYLDNNNNICRMSRINPDAKPYYQQVNNALTFIHYYCEGNSVVLIPSVNETPTGSLVFSYFMRPNELVDETRVATISNVTTTNSSGNITGISVAAAAVMTDVAHGLTTGNIINIQSTNCTPAISGNYAVTVIDANHFSVPVTTTGSGTTGSWTYTTTIFNVDQIPSNVVPFGQEGQLISGFSTSSLLDICQTLPGHQTLAYDVLPLAIDSVNKTITFYTPDLTTYSFSPNVVPAPVAGDYIAFAGECIIPQIPTELHDVLSQRVVLRTLQALGDAQGYGIAQTKLAEMEKATGNLIDNRTEGNPIKISNLNGTLRAVKAFNRARYY